MCYGLSSHVLLHWISPSGWKIPGEGEKQKQKMLRLIFFFFSFFKTFRSNGTNYFPINNIGVTLIVANKNRILVHINWHAVKQRVGSQHAQSTLILFFSCSPSENTRTHFFLYLFVFFPRVFLRVFEWIKPNKQKGCEKQ